MFTKHYTESTFEVIPILARASLNYFHVTLALPLLNYFLVLTKK